MCFSDRRCVLHWTGNLDGWLRRDTTSNNAIQVTSNANQSISPKARPDSLSPQAVTATREALMALRKIDAATQVEVSYMQYGPLIIDAKAKVNEALSLLPDRDLKRELNLVMDAYADAMEAWAEKIDGSHTLRTKYGVGKTLIPKYNLRTVKDDPLFDKTLGEGIDIDLAIRQIWDTGRNHLERASSLVQ